MYKESEILELKSSLGEWKEIIITLAAFANKNGGKVIVGLDDKGEPLGMSVGKGAIEDFVNKIKQHTDPLLYPSINIKTFGPGEIIEIDIPESDNKPVFAFDKAYTRVGKTNQKISNAELRNLIKRYTLSDFDKMFMEISADDADYDLDLIKSIDKDYYHFKVKAAADFLGRINLAKGNKITNAGYLCFAAKNTLMSNAIVKAARFKGRDMVKFLDMKDFDCNLITAVDEVMDFIRRQINMEVVISGKAKRDEIWDYPLPALREAIINAIVHRDYTDSGNIQIRIFDDRLEIWSPGLLPKEINISNLLEENRSIPRNRAIVDVFHRIELIERWGSGFQKIYKYSADNGNGEPSFSEKVGAFVITFNKRISGGGINGGISGGISGGINGGISGGISVAINELFEFIRTNPCMRLSEMAKRINIPSKTLEKWLAKLKYMRKIEYRGSKKTGGYFAI